jgi:hypothetical protein
MSTLKHRKMALAAMAATTFRSGVFPSPTEVDLPTQWARHGRARFMRRLNKQACVRIGALFAYKASPAHAAVTAAIMAGHV